MAGASQRNFFFILQTNFFFFKLVNSFLRTVVVKLVYSATRFV